MNTIQPINQSTNHLINYTLHLADTTLIMAQRISEWCAHGPILEQDIAITNISLDLLGQSRNFYQYAALLMNQQADQAGNPVTEDSLAYLRDEREFKNLLLTELPNGDWAQTISKLFFFSVFQQLQYEQLRNSKITPVLPKNHKEWLIISGGAANGFYDWATAQRKVTKE
jgi:ring-1,2-phenylacetyl-CoA epoxidase subunit PaaC